MTSPEQRQERVKNGSKRKRDLAVVAPASTIGESLQAAWEWAEKHVPDQDTAHAATCAYHLRWRKRPVNPDSVRALLRERNQLREGR
jgi:hypothetical protein